jgi:hypothetical protein
MDNATTTCAVDRLTEVIRNFETRMLTAFHDYFEEQAIRMDNLVVATSDLNTRMASLEQRVLNLEIQRLDKSTDAL